MKTDNLARNIERDLLAERPRSAPAPECFACGRGYVPKPPEGDDSTRFCSDRCREAFDAGFPPYDPTYHHKTNQRWYSLPLGKHGFLIDCACCGQRFDSKGLRCCSTACERGLGQKRETEELKAEAGVEFVSKMGAKRRCEAPGCTHDIPRWRNGRQVSKATRFCSPKCARSAQRPSGSPSGDYVVQTIKKCPENGPQNDDIKHQWALVRRSLRDPRNVGLAREWFDRWVEAGEQNPLLLRKRSAA